MSINPLLPRQERVFLCAGQSICGESYPCIPLRSWKLTAEHNALFIRTGIKSHDLTMIDLLVSADIRVSELVKMNRQRYRRQGTPICGLR